MVPQPGDAVYDEPDARDQHGAQDQQQPLDEQGVTFQRQWFNIVNEAPKKMAMRRYWDMAATPEGNKKNKDPDYTVGALIGLKDGQWYICDIRRGRWSPKQKEDLIKQKKSPKNLQRS